MAKKNFVLNRHSKLIPSSSSLFCQLNQILICISYIVDLHRPLSALAYSTVEAVCRCTPPPPPEHLSPAQTESYMHTIKILHAIEKITELLTLPTCPALHTPFTICMVGTTTIAHLSACKYVLKGRSLSMARERIRTSMGTLKSFEENWLLAGRTRREVGIVAREILGLEDSERSTFTTDAPAWTTSDMAHFSNSSSAASSTMYLIISLGRLQIFSCEGRSTCRRWDSVRNLLYLIDGNRDCHAHFGGMAAALSVTSSRILKQYYTSNGVADRPGSKATARPSKFVQT